MGVSLPTSRSVSRGTSRRAGDTSLTPGWQSPITNGLIIDIPGDLLDPQRMKDFSPVGTNHLTITSGRGVTGDGVTGFGLVPAVGGMLNITSFSASFWLTPGTIASSDAYVGRYDSGVSKRCWVINSSGTSAAALRVITSANGIAFSSWETTARPIQNGVLVHVAWTYNAGVSVVYINGVAAPGTGTIEPTLFSTDVGLTILGSLASGAVSGAASGTVRDVRFHSVVLTAEQVAAMYADPEYDPYDMTNGLEGKWRCSSSLAASLTGYPIIDSSGHNGHGVWTGCVGAGSRVGGPQTAKQHFSTRMFFSGASHYVTLASAFSPGTADFSFYTKFFWGGGR